MSGKEEKLQPPSVTTEDPGAHELVDSEESEDHFSDAQSEHHSGRSSPIPITRVEKVDNEPSHGEVPGTDAYKLREGDAQPDQIAVIPEEDRSQPSLRTSRPSTPGGKPIPTTVVEKIDASSPGHGEVPGTSAHEMRRADAVPDLVLRTPEGSPSPSNISRPRAGSTPGDLPIPITKVEKVDSEPRHGEIPGTEAYEMREGDAEPDIVEVVGDVPGSPTSNADRSPSISHARRNPSETEKTLMAEECADYDEAEDGEADAAFGDDFDDFAEGEEDAEFGDFNDDYREPEAVPSPPPQPVAVAPFFPVLDFDDRETAEDVMAATEPYLDALFPFDTISTSTIPSTPNSNSVFLTDRSASLWSQLVAPPPLQPPNWIRSRIRRLFLVSLGVPVDLDEILPASKQKKLILPSTHLHLTSNSPRTSTDSRSISRLKQGEGNTSSTSVDSQGKPSQSKRRKGPPPAPELDLVSARQLCSMTDEALYGLTTEELEQHVKKLESMRGTAEELLEYWTKRTDEKLGDREAFEGVIENLVKHARKVRK
ncbi:MAG: hypothetical protein M1818_007666 [Claussenomyces sp. TS43310]|nr:MAG: hypothetical protein M1818_007666 [Claussenomyces sp. TS43310]